MSERLFLVEYCEWTFNRWGDKVDNYRNHYVSEQSLAELKTDSRITDIRVIEEK